MSEKKCNGDKVKEIKESENKKTTNEPRKQTSSFCPKHSKKWFSDKRQLLITSVIVVWGIIGIIMLKQMLCANGSPSDVVFEKREESFGSCIANCGRKKVAECWDSGISPFRPSFESLVFGCMAVYFVSSLPWSVA